MPMPTIPRRTMPTTGRRFIVCAALREFPPFQHSDLPSAGELLEAATDGVPEEDLALIDPRGLIQYVPAWACEAVRG